MLLLHILLLKNFLLCLVVKQFLDNCGELLLCEGATLDVRGEATELVNCEEGRLEVLLRPNAADPVTSCPNSLFSRVVDHTQLGDYFLSIFIVIVLLPLLHGQGEPCQVGVILRHHL